MLTAYLLASSQENILIGKGCRWLNLCVIILLVIGVGMFSKGMYMQAKAHFAQYLIADAWQQTLIDHHPHKPWPWADTHPIAKLSFVSKFEDNLAPVWRTDERVATRAATSYFEDPQQFDQSLYVLAGASGRNLAFGPALVMSGAMPNQLGNTIIAGHRDTHFSILNGIEQGQMIRMTDIQGRDKFYRVTKTQIRHESQNSVMAATNDDRLTLITCYPFDAIGGGAELRFVVTAVLMR